MGQQTGSRSPKEHSHLAWMIALTPVVALMFFGAVVMALFALVITRVVQSGPGESLTTYVAIAVVVLFVASNAIMAEKDRQKMLARGVEITPLAGVFVLVAWPIAVPWYLFTSSRRAGMSTVPAWSWVAVVVLILSAFAAEAAGRVSDTEYTERPSPHNKYAIGEAADAYIDAVRSSGHTFERDIEKFTLWSHAETVCTSLDSGITFEETVSGSLRWFEINAADAEVLNRLTVEIVCPKHGALLPAAGA